MTTKKIMLLCAGLLGLGVVIAGLCLGFLSNGKITLTPSDISVEQIEGKNFVVASYSPDFGYRFKIEQKFDDNFVFLKTVDTEKNVLELSGEEFSFGVFRFSACYINENGAGGEFSSTYEWSVKTRLAQVDYSSVNLSGDSLSWTAVPRATSYQLGKPVQ